MSKNKTVSKDILSTKNVLVIGRHELYESRSGCKYLLQPDGVKWDCQVKIINMDDRDMEIDLIGFDSSIVNAFRRIIATDVPTVAIDMANIFYNSSIIPDEMYASILGLIPINAHPSLLQYKKDPLAEITPQNSIRFDLKVICKTNEAEGSKYKDLSTVKRKVMSSNLEYVSMGDQAIETDTSTLRPLEEDIIIGILNNGQELNIEAYAHKGCGRDHAKFVPAHCYYRLLPLIELTKQVEGEQARKLQSCFSEGVISVTNKKGKEIAKVENARIDSCSRNIHRHNDLKDLVNLGRKSDHFIFYIESQSCLKSHEILLNSIDIFIDKCDVLLNALTKDPDEEMKD